jgi:hypothetical protein
LVDLRAVFLARRPEAFLVALLADLLAVFLRDRLRALGVTPACLLGAGSSKSNDDGDEVGVGEGMLSDGSGSIHPEPDQPISI